MHKDELRVGEAVKDTMLMHGRGVGSGEFKHSAMGIQSRVWLTWFGKGALHVCNLI